MVGILVAGSLAVAGGIACWYKIVVPLARLVEVQEESMACQHDLPVDEDRIRPQPEGFMQDLVRLASATGNEREGIAASSQVAGQPIPAPSAASTEKSSVA